MSISLKDRAKCSTRYDTWNAFKRDLELNLWCHVANDIWLQVKPKRALPWNASDMVTAIDAIFEKPEIHK